MSRSGVPRDQLFLTTKIPGSLHGGCCGCPGAAPPGQCLVKCHGVCFPAAGHYTEANATEYIHKDLKTLFDAGVDYIDLLLLHEPCDYLAPYPYNASAETAAVYGAMDAALHSTDRALKGRIKAIGVSNFDSNMLSLLAQSHGVTPAVNQCRMSVGGYDKKTHEYCKAHGITYQAYSPLHGDLSAAPVTAAAAAHSVSTAQVTLRWITQLGVPLVTASNQSKYDTEDMAIFGFELSSAELEAISNVGQCAANPSCAAAKGSCISDGCEVCGKTPLAKACGSCGCVKCCAGCKLTTFGGEAYCAEEKEAGDDGYVPPFLR